MACGLLVLTLLLLGKASFIPVDIPDNVWCISCLVISRLLFIRAAKLCVFLFVCFLLYFFLFFMMRTSYCIRRGFASSGVDNLRGGGGGKRIGRVEEMSRSLRISEKSSHIVPRT